MYAGKIFKIPISGTLAHSYIMSFEDDFAGKLELNGKEI